VITSPALTTRAPQRQSLLVTGAIIVTVLAWASAFVVIRGAAAFFSGGALALGRLLVGSALLSLSMLGRRWVRPTGREWLQVTAFGLAWFGAYNVVLNIAERTLDAGTTAMVVNTGPILIALGAGWILREGIPKWLAIGGGVAFVGVVCIGIGTGSPGLGSTGPGGGTGVVWALTAAITYAVGVLFQKPALRRLPSAQVTWLGCIVGTLACLPFSGELVSGLAAAPVSAILGVVYLGAVPTALAFSTWGYALARMPAGRLGISTYVVPPLAIALGFIVFAEVPAPVAIAGGAICLVGVALSRKRA
jgi:drug/metabolite transporter (DMT)-like permease